MQRTTGATTFSLAALAKGLVVACALICALTCAVCVPRTAWAEPLQIPTEGMQDYGDFAYVDGKAVAIDQRDDASITIDISGDSPAILTLYSFNAASGDPHSIYPTHMKVWLLSPDAATGTYAAEYLPQLDDVLQYAGTSIRITGKQGIRIITGVPTATKRTLIDEGIAAGQSTWHLAEYGTTAAFTANLQGQAVLLTNTSMKNHAFKEGVSDPVFATKNGLVQYTNVLVGFTTEQCSQDLSLRPYLILEDENGAQLTVYGGMVTRSIGFIAYQNRNAFSKGSTSYNFIWSIIHAAYGDAYDDEGYGPDPGSAGTVPDVDPDFDTARVQWFRLVSASNSDVALTLSGIAANGVQVTMATAGNNDNQIWGTIPQNDGTFLICSYVNTSLLLTADTLSKRSAVTVWEGTGNHRQSWDLVTLSEGLCKVQVAGTSWYLDTEGTTTMVGSKGILWTANSSSTQQWVMVPVADPGAQEQPGEPEMDDAEYFASFEPTVRFMVASDVHLIEADSTEAQHLRALFAKGVALTGGKLDAVALVGDITDTGTASAFANLKATLDACTPAGVRTLLVLGNHDYYYNARTTESTFTGTFGTDVNFHVIIGGYHFIGVSPSAQGWGFDAQDRAWLTAQLEAAVADDPDKPIFVFHHEPTSNTVYGSEFWGVGELYSVLCNYPQVIDFAGHSHFPIEDPRSIWQGAYTAIGTGTMSYFERGLNGVASYNIFPSGTLGDYTNRVKSNGLDAAQCYLVEVDENGAVRVTGYDLLSGDAVTRYYLRSPGDKPTFVYNTSRRYYYPKAAWSAGAMVEAADVEGVAGRVQLTFPAALAGGLTESYRVEVLADGKVVDTVYALSNYYYRPIPTTVVVTLSGLTEGTAYEVRVVAVNPYGADCAEPLTCAFVAGEISATEPEPEGEGEGEGEPVTEPQPEDEGEGEGEQQPVTEPQPEGEEEQQQPVTEPQPEGQTQQQPEGEGEQQQPVTEPQPEGQTQQQPEGEQQPVTDPVTEPQPEPQPAPEAA